MSTEAPLHARLSPSNLRWPKCPGSIEAEAPYPDVSGAAAIDGTGSHELLELCILENNNAADYIGQTVGIGHHDMPLGWVVHQDRAERVQMALDYIDRRVAELEAEYPDCEVRVEPESKSNPGQFAGRDDWEGTADITITVWNSKGQQLFCEIADYKDGRMWVDEEDNTQLQSYLIGKAYGALAAKERKLRMTIIQPKTKTPVRYSGDHDSKYLSDTFIELKEAAEATDVEGAPRIPGPHCGWCKANPKRGGDCMAALEESSQELATVGLDTSVLTDLDVKKATGEQLGAILSQKKAFEDVFKRVEEEAYLRATQGLEVTGWGIGTGNASRSWSDEDDVIAAFKSSRVRIDDYSPRKLLSPSQAEKFLGSKFTQKFKDLVVTVEGKAKLVPVNKVKAAPKSIEDIFNEVPAKAETKTTDATATAEPFSFL